MKKKEKLNLNGLLLISSIIFIAILLILCDFTNLDGIQILSVSLMTFILSMLLLSSIKWEVK